jgi:membrane-bound serine protease (ClpP class)
VKSPRLLAVMFALALAGCASSDGGAIEVIDVSGPLDGRALGFIADSIEGAAERGQEIAVVQINSPAVLDGPAFDRVLQLLQDPPLPVATWVGPYPAVAYGGAAVLATTVEHAAVAPGATWGLVNPVVLGEERTEVIGPDEIRPVEELASASQEPAIRQFLEKLDGEVFSTSLGPVTVATLEQVDGQTVLKTVMFRKPGLVDRFFRLAVSPEAAFFFLVVGLTIVAFEFYALGPGVAAAVAAVSLLLAGWGVVTLPTRWWAFALAVAGWLLMTRSHQAGGAEPSLVAGTLAMFAGGVLLIDGEGQIDPRWWLVLLSVLAVLFFYLLAMPTVSRARLSTMTVGREGLMGMAGVATTEFTPDGVVEIAGARWRATAHREAGLSPGAEVVVIGVDGLFLEVEPKPSPREN